MKKIIIVALGALVILNSSCLKDKGFDNQEYGIKDPGAQYPGVGFDLLSGTAIVKDLSVSGEISSSQKLDSSYLAISLLAENLASSDLTVTLAVDSKIVTDYNTANPSQPRMTVMTSSQYIIQNINVVIPAGSNKGYVKISIPNATLLDKNKIYGIGLKIVSADNGITVASNMSKCIAKVVVKNIYDGVYFLDFQNFHPSRNTDNLGDTTTVELRTSSANSVKIFWPDVDAYANPSILDGGLNTFPNQEPNYTIDNTTSPNLVVVDNASSAASIAYEMNPDFISYYDPATKKFYVKWGYYYQGGIFDATQTREWTQTFTYLRPTK
jgi:hypothetical protein